MGILSFVVIPAGLMTLTATLNGQLPSIPSPTSRHPLTREAILAGVLGRSSKQRITKKNVGDDGG